MCLAWSAPPLTRNICTLDSVPSPGFSLRGLRYRRHAKAGGLLSERNQRTRSKYPALTSLPFARSGHYCTFVFVAPSKYQYEAIHHNILRVVRRSTVYPKYCIVFVQTNQKFSLLYNGFNTRTIRYIYVEGHVPVYQVIDFFVAEVYDIGCCRYRLQRYSSGPQPHRTQSTSKRVPTVWIREAWPSSVDVFEAPSTALLQTASPNPNTPTRLFARTDEH